MYLIVIAWLYVTLLMALAEAFSTQGNVLGAIITFVFYGIHTPFNNFKIISKITKFYFITTP